MDISNLDKALVLTKLYNNALSSREKEYDSITEEKAREIIEKRGNALYFNTLLGKTLKVSLSEDVIDTRMYNAYNGAFRAELALALV